MPSCDFYHDSALTEQVTALNPIAAAQDEADSLPPVDVQIWLGSTDDDWRFQADSDPGVDPIVVSVVDAAGGSGQPATAVKLATSQGGLDAATPGDPLSLGTQVDSGTGNALNFWVRLDDATAAAGAYTDIKLQSVTLRMTPIV